MQADGSKVSNQAPWPGEFESFFQNVNRLAEPAAEPLQKADSQPAYASPDPGEFARFSKPGLESSVPPVSTPQTLDSPRGGELTAEYAPPALTSEIMPPLPAMQPLVNDAAPVAEVGGNVLSTSVTNPAAPSRRSQKWLILITILAALSIIIAMFLMK